MSEAEEKARLWCATVRTKPTPLSEAIPMVQSLCDEITDLRTKLAQLELALKQKDEACKNGLNANSVLGKNEYLREALDIQPSQEALDAYVMSRLELACNQYINEPNGEKVYALLDEPSPYDAVPFYRLKDK